MTDNYFGIDALEAQTHLNYGWLIALDRVDRGAEIYESSGGSIVVWAVI